MSKDVNSSEKRLAIGEGVKIYTKKTDGGGEGAQQLRIKQIIIYNNLSTTKNKFSQLVIMETV